VDAVACFDIWKSFINFSEIGVCFVIEKFECDCYAGQLKDVDVTVTAVR
jgi:hypothetical protein